MKTNYPTEKFVLQINDHCKTIANTLGHLGEILVFNENPEIADVKRLVSRLADEIENGIKTCEIEIIGLEEINPDLRNQLNLIRIWSNNFVNRKGQNMRSLLVNVMPLLGYFDGVIAKLQNKNDTQQVMLEGFKRWNLHKWI